MYYVYILKCADKSYYVGSTKSIKARINNHKYGLVHTTKDKRPLKLVWYGCFTNNIKASRFEKYLKHGSGFAFRNKHLI